MFRLKVVFCNKIFRRSILVGSAIVTPSVLQNAENSVSSNSLTSKNKDTGWDRLRTMFSYDEWGNMSKEMTAVCQTTFISGFIGVCYGGFIYSREAYLDFLERNQATKFTNHMEAKRRLQNHVTINFGIGAFKWSWRLALFSGIFVLMLTSISTYRGSTSVFDYMGGGIIAGTLYQLKIGPRGMIVGGTLGGMLGLFAGTLSQTLLTLSGSSLEDVIAWQYNFDKIRKDQMRIAEKNAAELRLGDKTMLLESHKKIEEKSNS